MIDSPDLSYVDETVERIGRGADRLVPILHALHRHYRYLPREALRRVCELTEITSARIEGVSTFYPQFRHTPAGEHTIRVCIGTACHVKGANAVHDALRAVLDVPEAGDTDPDGRYTVEKVACLGCCTLAPVVQIDDVTYGHLTPETVGRALSDFERLRAERRRRGGRAAPSPSARAAGEVRVSMDTCCLASGAEAVRDAFAHALLAAGAVAGVKPVGCPGLSYMEPLVEIVQPGGVSTLYAAVTPEDAPAIVARHFPPAGLWRRARLAAGRALGALVSDWRNEGLGRFNQDVRDETIDAFIDPQQRIVTEHAGEMDPGDLHEYRRRGGFEALAKVLREFSPEGVIEQIRIAGLRGRGGAGYPTWRKWSTVRAAQESERLVICNGDEGDPGAFMDRMLLEGHAFRVLEGIAIAAYAVGAAEGVVYVRSEYPVAVRRVTDAVAAMEAEGLLGEDILGHGVSLRLRLLEGAGAFVCGEETALIASIEGRRGTPRPRPPYPSEHGLFGRPTLVNNVETFACLPWILRNGPEAFAERGTETSHGTKVFALAGKVRRGGMIEVPMGMTIRQVVEDIGGGIADGRRLKAVQIGGPSGGCVPAELADAPIDYEALRDVGAMMGSGGLVVLDETDCMVDIARYFLQFTQAESCGRCTFCRIGTRRMLEILERLCGGEGRPADLEALEELAGQVRAGSLCGLGRTAGNPVLSTLRYFREEYEAHAAGHCPAGFCKALITYSITEDCIGCTRCAQICPSGAIAMRPYERHEIDAEKCIRCGGCGAVCPAEAVRVH